jgi:hypothetical protein
MRRWFIVLFLLSFMLHFVFAGCSQGQIDINSASLSELDKINHVGEKTAQRIIDLRPFNSIDDLERVPYISAGYVEDIKSQGLACVSEESSEEDKEKEEDNDNEKTSQKDSKDEKTTEEDYESIEEKAERLNREIDYSIIEKENEVISLSPQNIKSDNDSDFSKDYAKYGLVLFCIFLCSLFAVKKFNIRKNEFR